MPARERAIRYAYRLVLPLVAALVSMLATVGTGHAATYCSSGIYASTFTVPPNGALYVTFYSNRQVQNVMFNAESTGGNKSLQAGGASNFSGQQIIFVRNILTADSKKASGWFVETYFC